MTFLPLSFKCPHQTPSSFSAESGSREEYQTLESLETTIHPYQPFSPKRRALARDVFSAPGASTTRSGLDRRRLDHPAKGAPWRAEGYKTKRGSVRLCVCGSHVIFVAVVRRLQAFGGLCLQLGTHLSVSVVFASRLARTNLRCGKRYHDKFGSVLTNEGKQAMRPALDALHGVELIHFLCSGSRNSDCARRGLDACVKRAFLPSTVNHLFCRPVLSSQV